MLKNKSHLLDALRCWIAASLPQLNQAAEAGVLTAAEMISVANHWTRKVVREIGGSALLLSQEQARKYLQLVSFPVSSAERHAQAANRVPGFALKALPGVEELLVDLGRAADLPPRDSHYSYWLNNKGDPPLTFTGDDMEIFFHSAVLETERLNATSADALRAIANGSVDLRDPVASELLKSVTNNMRDLQQLYRSFMAVDPVTGRQPITPDFFATRLRTYLPTYPVGGQNWAGVNAGNLASQLQVDYLLGTVADGYEKTVEKRWPYLSGEDQRALRADMDGGSVTGAVLELLEINAQAIRGGSNETMLRTLSGSTAARLPGVLAFADAVDALGRFSSVHWALIVHFLQKFAKEMPQDVLSRLPVSPDAGTGQTSHGETWAITEMRRNHPVVGPLVKALRTLPRSEAA